MAWTPVSETIEEIGRLALFVGNRDLSFYRGAPTLINSWSSSEPYDDKALSFLLPAVTSFDPRSSLPFSDFEDVDLWIIDDEGTKIKKLWEGFIASETDDLSPTDNGLEIECLGALYQADLFIKQPNFGFAVRDAGQSIATEFNARAAYYGLRTTQMNWLSWTSAPTRNNGSWNELMTGWAQEMLSNAHSPIFMFDNEQATAICCNEWGYIVTGNYFTQIPFGERQRRYGSKTWWNIVFIHLFGYDGLYVSDAEYDHNNDVIVTLSWGGYVDVTGDTTYSNPPVSWIGDQRNNSNVLMVDVELHPNEWGYWLLRGRGGQVIPYGACVHYGDCNISGTRTLGTGEVIPRSAVDMVSTPSGNGYWVLDWTGYIFMFGDAASYCNVDAPLPFDDMVYIGIERTADGHGLWVLDAIGRVKSIGPVPVNGSQTPLSGRTVSGFRDISRSRTGNGFAIVTYDGLVYTYGDQPNLGSARFSADPTAGGDSAQFTLMKWMGRRPVIRTKNTWDVHWTITTGTPGVSHTITRDRTQHPNVFYGEGTDPAGCHWRNTFYPNSYPGGYFPEWPGYYMSANENQSAPGVLQWQLRMRHNGWPIDPDGYFDDYDGHICRMMQAKAGLTPNGVVDGWTWSQTFVTGLSNLGPDSLRGAYIAPLALDNKVEPFLYNANGAIIGSNPSWDPSMMRIETYNNYGENTSKRDAIISALAELKRNRDPGYMGTITLNIDPEENSRFYIHAGENILMKAYRGEDVLFHISEVSVDFENGSVTLTVDSKARDHITVAAMLERDRTIGEPPLKSTRPSNSAAKQVPDTKVVWDCESNAGVVSPFTANGGWWHVVKIPVGEAGTVVKVAALTIPATEFSVGIFDRPVLSADLAAIGRPDDLDEPDSDYAYWDRVPAEAGLVISWGGPEQMAGYWPGTSEDEEITGVLIDTASWNFWSTSPPWIWVAVFCVNTATFGMRMYPGEDTGFNISTPDSIANPARIAPISRPSDAFFPGAT